MGYALSVFLIATAIIKLFSLFNDGFSGRDPVFIGYDHSRIIFYAVIFEMLLAGSLLMVKDITTVQWTGVILLGCVFCAYHLNLPDSVDGCGCLGSFDIPVELKRYLSHMMFISSVLMIVLGAIGVASVYQKNRNIVD